MRLTPQKSAFSFYFIHLTVPNFRTQIFFWEDTNVPKVAKPKSFKTKAAAKKPAKPRAKTGPRTGKGPGGFPMEYGS